MEITTPGEHVATLEELQPQLEVERPNRQQRRAQLRQAKHNLGKATAKSIRKDHRTIVRWKSLTQGISGNPAKRFVQLQSKIEIENAYRGHV